MADRPTAAALLSEKGAGALGFRRQAGGAQHTTVYAKLQEVVSVQDFGAKADNVTDDWPAIDAGLAHLRKLPEGGTLFLPAGKYRVGRQIRIPEKCILRGAGCPATSLIATDDFRGESLICNADQSGNQEWASLEGLNIDGNRSRGAICSVAVVDMVSVFVNSYIRDVVIAEGSNVGLRIASRGGCGPMYFENIWLARNSGDNLLVENLGQGAFNGLLFVNLASENPGPGRAAIRLRDDSGNRSALGWHFLNTHIEMEKPGPGSRGIVLDGVNSVTFDSVQLLSGKQSAMVGIEITGKPENTHIQLRGVTNANLIDPVLLDLKHNVRHSAVNLPWYATPEIGIYPERGYMVYAQPVLVPDLSRGNHVEVHVKNAHDIAIMEPINAVDGMSLTIEIINLTSGAMGRVSWRFGTVAARDWVSPGKGLRKTVLLRRRQGSWVQVGAASPEF